MRFRTLAHLGGRRRVRDFVSERLPLLVANHDTDGDLVDVEVLGEPDPMATVVLEDPAVPTDIDLNVGEVVEDGDVMYDAVLAVRDRALDESTPLPVSGIRPDEYVLATVHRAANTDDPARLAGVLDGLAGIDSPVVLPLHPRTEAALDEHGLYDRTADKLRLVDPVGYVEFLRLLSDASKVATDSGGVQKEAFYLDTPCVTLRDETEWIETVEVGWNVLVGADPDRITRALTDRSALPPKPELYGGGDAAERTVAALEATLGDQPSK